MILAILTVNAPHLYALVSISQVELCIHLILVSHRPAESDGYFIRSSSVSNETLGDWNRWKKVLVSLAIGLLPPTSSIFLCRHALPFFSSIQEPPRSQELH